MAVSETASIDMSAALVAGPTPLADWLVVLPVVIPIIAGALLLMFRHEVRTHAVLAIGALALAFASACGLLYRVLNEGPLVMTMGRWLPPFGISFNADPLGATFAATASFVAVAGAIFAIRDIGATERRYGFYPFLLLMMAGVNGAFLTGDIFNLYVWFEVFVISSFGLLVLGSERRQIDGATKYAVLNLVATTIFLITTGLLYGAIGTLNMADIARKAPALRESAPLMTLATLYLLAFGMKAAAFPLNFWLPASYHTPRIVTSALFGGLLTKVGIYALLRVFLTLLPEERGLLADLMAWLAAATMIIGILGALSQADLRRIAGFVVISGVGVMLAGLAIGNSDGIAGSILYAIHSILGMTALYLLAGLMREAGGSFTLHELSGLYRSNPLMAAAALGLVLAVAGLPPLSGLWPKVLLVKASLDTGAWWLALAILSTSLLTTIALGRVFALSYWRMPASVAEASADTPAEKPDLRLGYGVLLLLALPMILIGLNPEPFLQLAGAAASGLIDPAGYVGAVFPVEIAP